LQKKRRRTHKRESSTGCLQGEKFSPGASETGYYGLNYKWLRHEYAIQSST
jgi:hypothetical protein